jgi:hypothetical protein
MIYIEILMTARDNRSDSMYDISLLTSLQPFGWYKHVISVLASTLAMNGGHGRWTNVAHPDGHLGLF